MTPILKRHWSFSLRTLFALMTVVALIVGYPAMKVTERRWLARRLETRGALVVTWSDETGHDPPAILRAFGAKPVQWIELPKKGFTSFDMSHIAGCFPEARISERPFTFWDPFCAKEIGA